MTMLCDGMLLGAGGAGAGIVFVGAGVGSTSVSALQTINAPSGLLSGDFLVSALFANNAAVRSISSRPSGWTNRRELQDTSGLHLVLDTKVAGGSEPGNYTWNWNTTISGVGMILAFRKPLGLSLDIAGAIGPEYSSSVTSVAPSLTATQAGALISFFATRVQATITTPPSGMTQCALQSGAGLGTIAAFDLIPSLVGASGSKTNVFSAAELNAAVSLQIY